MLFQATVFAGQIFLLVLVWSLFQQARSQLSVRAAETPVLSEVKALHRSVKSLLAEIETTADQTSGRMENRFAEGQALLQELDRRITTLKETEARLLAWQTPVSSSDLALPTPLPDQAVVAVAPQATRKKRTRPVETPLQASTENAPPSAPATSPKEERRQAIFTLADAGETVEGIARTTGASSGEVEMLLGLRNRRK